MSIGIEGNVAARVGALASAVAVAGCGLLDVGNPNDLEEEAIRAEALAAAVVNGTVALVSSAVSQSWQPYLVASDELHWTGSRNAWQSLDQGFVDDPLNEFTDGAFPAMGQARWMSDLAVEILDEHVSSYADSEKLDQLEHHRARANLYSGIIYMVIGEVQEDFAFSDRNEGSEPVGRSNMHTVLDDAIARLDAAVSGFEAVGDDDMVASAMAVRARAHHSRGVWDAINPSASGEGLVNSAEAAADAQAVVDAVAGADWLFNLTYSAASVPNSMAAWINDRKENQLDTSIVTLSGANDIDGISLRDPINRVRDPSVIKWLNQWKGGDYRDRGGIYPPLTIASTRMMHVIMAENALASGDTDEFAEHINDLRSMDRLTGYFGQIPRLQMLQHMRRVTVLLQGLRLADMYRWGIEGALWQDVSDAVRCPGVMLPVPNIERTANQQDWEAGCS